MSQPLGNVTSWRAEPWTNDFGAVEGKDIPDGVFFALTLDDADDAVAAHNATVARLNKALDVLHQFLAAHDDWDANIATSKIVGIEFDDLLSDSAKAARTFLASLK